MNNNPQTLKQGGETDNGYYLKIAGVMRFAKYVTLVVMIIYLLLTIAVYRSELTLENFRYLIKYFDSSSTEHSEGLKNYRDIYFDATSEIMLGLYSSDLAVVKRDSVDIYNMLGSNTLSYSINYKNPVLMTSDKYMLTYALGENSYVINNAFSKLYTGNTEYAITGAALSDSGMYAIASRTLEYKGAVTVYDDSFKPVSRILKDKYITDVDMTSGGDELLVASVYNKNGSYMSEIMTVSPYSDKARATIDLSDIMVMRARYNSYGGYTVVCNDRLLFYNSNDELTETVSYNGSVPTNCSIAGEYTTIVFNENAVGSRSRIHIYNSNGSEQHTTALDGRIIDIESDEKYVYILFEDSIARIDPVAGKVVEAKLDGGCLALVLKDHEVVLVCYTNRATAYSIDALVKEQAEAAETETADDDGDSTDDPETVTTAVTEVTEESTADTTTAAVTEGTAAVDE